MPRLIDDETFAMLDTETTGISPAYGARLCELAILLVRGGRPVGSYQTLIDPGVPIEWGAQSVHGITDAMVAGKPAFRDIAQKVYEMLDGKVMVCHNLPFDRGFLRAEFQVAGVPMPPVKEVCTLKLARRHFKFRRNSLGHIVDVELRDYFRMNKGPTTAGAHRALHDVEMLNGVFQYFIEDLRTKRRLEVVEDLLELVRA